MYIHSELMVFHVYIQCLLTNPQDRDPNLIANEEAAFMYRHRPHTFQQMVMDCVTASLKIEGTVYIMTYS